MADNKRGSDVSSPQEAVKRIKSSILLSLAERVAMTAVTLTQENDLSERYAEDILRLAAEAVSRSTNRGFGE